MDDFFRTISIMLVPGLLAITMHEAAHGYVAWHFGDPTAKMLGRLTINPIKHIDPIGTVVVPLVVAVLSQFQFIFGWAKPVPVMIENLKNPKKDMVYVSAAGPFVNIIIALVSALLLRGISSAELLVLGSVGEIVAKPVALMLFFSVYINSLLAVFNLLPIPPLDGGRILVGLLPIRFSIALERIEPYGMMIVIILYVTKVLQFTLFPLHSLLVSLLVGNISLSGLIH